MDVDAELSALATQEDLPADLLRRLLQHPGTRRSAALLRRDLSEEMVEDVRGAVAAHVRDEPSGVLARLAEDPDPLVRSFLTMDDHLSPELLARLPPTRTAACGRRSSADGAMFPMPCAGCC
ncbi:hypothetical protein ACGFSI_42755 [Streptomyces virginiae]|uniref:hypothetical protein n=1 Tax=Streptomyces virginiae TaxID=1961 RepID=UPI0037218D8E